MLFYDTNLAKEMILAAKKAGAHAVKFQTFDTESIITFNTPKVKYQEKTTSPKETHYEMIKSLELSKEKHQILFDFCEKYIFCHEQNNFFYSKSRKNIFPDLSICNGKCKSWYCSLNTPKVKTQHI